MGYEELETALAEDRNVLEAYGITGPEMKIMTDLVFGS